MSILLLPNPDTTCPTHHTLDTIQYQSANTVCLGCNLKRQGVPWIESGKTGFLRETGCESFCLALKVPTLEIYPLHLIGYMSINRIQSFIL